MATVSRHGKSIFSKTLPVHTGDVPTENIMVTTTLAWLYQDMVQDVIEGCPSLSASSSR
jgi:hypothetical protein